MEKVSHNSSQNHNGQNGKRMDKMAFENGDPHGKNGNSHGQNGFSERNT
jgi:hypothetical protein